MAIQTELQAAQTSRLDTTNGEANGEANGHAEHQADDVRVSDYSEWKPQDYLSEYYGEVMPDEHFAMEFLVESLRHVAPVAVALEFGCGPTIHHSLPMATVAGEIHMAEYLENNRAQIQQWLDRDSQAFDWTHFGAETLELEGNSAPTAAQIEERERLLREKVTQVVPGDAFDADPLGEQKRGFYPLVASHYCAEGCTTDKEEWRVCMSHIAGLVAPGGVWILSACGASNAYAVGERYFPCAGINEFDVLSSLQENGFTDIDLRVRQVPGHADQGFSSVVFARAVKGAAVAA